MTKQEIALRKRLACQKYYQSPKGQISAQKRRERYQRSAKGKAHIVEYSFTPRRKATQLCATAKRRATLKGLTFNITSRLIEERLIQINGKCEVTGDSLDYQRPGNGLKNPFAPSLDQKIPGAGYTPENIQIVAEWYNRMKGTLTDAEAINILSRPRWRNNV